MPVKGETIDYLATVQVTELSTDQFMVLYIASGLAAAIIITLAMVMAVNLLKKKQQDDYQPIQFDYVNDKMLHTYWSTYIFFHMLISSFVIK